MHCVVGFPLITWNLVSLVQTLKTRPLALAGSTVPRAVGWTRDTRPGVFRGPRSDYMD